MEKETAVEKKGEIPIETIETASIDAPINASGHIQELDRNFGLISVLAISNGGPPGVIYEFIAVSFFYWLIAASLAELASAVPSAGGVYHWASITGGRYGRVCGWFAGWWNFFGWIVGLASLAQILAAMCTSMYALFHPGFVVQRWHVFVAYLGIIWVPFVFVLWANRFLPPALSLAGFITIAGCVVIVIVCPALSTHNTNEFVWQGWQNLTGYESDGFVFLLGMLNGAFTVGTPDVITHLAEEVPKPSSNLPKAILAQYVFGFISAFVYLLAIFYGISDFPAVLAGSEKYLFPLTEIYRQCTGTAGGTLALLLLGWIPFFISAAGSYLTASRVFWTLARDNATPFSKFFGKINQKNRNPSNSIIFCACLCTALGCIYLGSATAFSAFVGSFVILTTLSYLMAILPHLLSGRKNVPHGWFWMNGWTGFVVNGISCLYIIVFDVIFLFPFVMPVTAATMNYASLITGGLTLFVAAFWFWRQKDYVGPPSMPQEISAKDAI